ncbi:multidrug efflux SMR transporter [Donghicola sp.]|jgi:quaternary ammonium compound-resistance protein SugE|uniref:DMT family transporter n=1 Tax=Donghicola sp. TaxID=1929294 RepID=UPI0025D900A3|nr:multidrug efflux SMR transporter [Donghicola sp.]MCT4578807.1 multidrug efflux SMR transporter [Donghicola sp.]
MAWFILFFAGLLEIVWATAMKSSMGFTRFWPSVLTIVTMLGSFGLLAIATKTLPLGTSYMVWSGIGAVGAFIAGIILFGEDLSPVRLAAGTMIVCGITLMKLGT